MVHPEETILPLLILPGKAWWEAATQPGAQIGLDEPFPKQTFRNRIRLSQRNSATKATTANRELESVAWLDFSIPMAHDAGRTGWNARMDPSSPWRKHLWRTLLTHWSPLPFWEVLGPELEPLVLDSEPLWHCYVYQLNSWMAAQWGAALPPRVQKRPTLDFSPKKGILAESGGVSWTETLLREGPALYL
jgi:hypothetical protein